jgi:site-specific DNA-methyltransferase (adenine-specific)
MPLRIHEDICVFYENLPKYNPQMEQGQRTHKRGTKGTAENNCYGKFDVAYAGKETGNQKYPNSTLYFDRVLNALNVHPTQKPVALFEYLIRTYTNEGDTILDNCIGSGTTGIVAINSGRNFIGIEKDPEMATLARKRIAQETAQERMFV